MTYLEFAKMVKAKRESLLISQKEFAYRIPMHKTTYNKVENGKQEPTFFQLQRIAQLLNLDLTELFHIKKPNPTD